MKFNIHWPWHPAKKYQRLPLYLIIPKFPFFFLSIVFEFLAKVIEWVWVTIETPFINYLERERIKYWKRVYEERDKLNAQDPKV